MHTRKIINAFTLLLFSFMCFLPVATVWAQESNPQPSVAIREDFSDDELRSFVKANERVMAIQTESEQKIINAIESEGLTIDRFNEILEQQRDPSRTSETSSEELASFNHAAQMILEENEKIEKQMMTSIQEEGIDTETYKEIMVAYQQLPQLQSRVHELLKKQN